MKRIALIFWFLGVLAFSSVAQDVGDPAPDFTLTGLDGQTYTLSELRGKVVYVFLFGANCPRCRQSAPSTQTGIYDEFSTDENFVALGIDTWNLSRAAVTAFRNQTGLTYPLLLNGASVTSDYLTTYDRNLVIGADGLLAYSGNSPANTDVRAVVNAINSELSLTVSNEEDVFTPNEISLDQNFPNPFNPTTQIPFELQQVSDVSIQIFNVLGQVVSEINRDNLSSGRHSVTFNAVGLSSGIYFYRLSVNGNFITQRSMTLLK